MKNYIFLDIDGVLTSTRVHLAAGKRGIWASFDPVAVSFLEKICNKWPAEIIISSTWRAMFQRHDWDHLFGLSNLENYIHQQWRTGHAGGDRPEEVSDWLRDHGGSEYNYLILDDSHYQWTDEQKGHLILTAANDGMQWHHYEMILNKTQLTGKL